MSACRNIHLSSFFQKDPSGLCINHSCCACAAIGSQISLEPPTT
jgi:hypothetical protein